MAKVRTFVTVDCPYCSVTFTKRKDRKTPWCGPCGQAIGHTKLRGRKKGGADAAFETRTCRCCRRTFFALSSSVRKHQGKYRQYHGDFCSNTCYNQWKIDKRRKGKFAPAECYGQPARISRTCEQCKSTFQMLRSLLEDGRRRGIGRGRFCSLVCKRVWYANKPTGVSPS